MLPFFLNRNRLLPLENFLFIFRQKAIRDLTERLSRSQRDDTGNWPEMEVEGEEVETKEMASSVELVNFNFVTITWLFLWLNYFLKGFFKHLFLF